MERVGGTGETGETPSMLILGPDNVFERATMGGQT
jgi:hypothetical protein